jgi:hypothetical protein
MDSQEKTAFDWGLWFQWMVATTMGWVLGQILFPELALVVTGLAIGVLQWLVLQHRIRTAWRWAAATVIGWTIGGVFVLVAVPVEIEFLAGPIFGAGAGIAQWLVLRREVHWSGWWPVVSTLAWTTGLLVLPGFMFSGVMAGMMTGFVLELLLRYPRLPETRDQEQTPPR